MAGGSPVPGDSDVTMELEVRFVLQCLVPICVGFRWLRMGIDRITHVAIGFRGMLVTFLCGFVLRMRGVFGAQCVLLFGACRSEPFPLD